MCRALSISPEMFLEISSRTSPRDICNLAIACKTWHTLLVQAFNQMFACLQLRKLPMAPPGNFTLNHVYSRVHTPGDVISYYQEMAPVSSYQRVEWLYHAASQHGNLRSVIVRGMRLLVREMCGHGLTHEQQVVVDYPVTGTNGIFLQAGAGSGKTTCLKEWARKNSDKSGTFICFNRSIAEEMTPVLPDVTCTTFHALCWRWASEQEAYKLSSDDYEIVSSNGLRITRSESHKVLHQFLNGLEPAVKHVHAESLQKNKKYKITEIGLFMKEAQRMWDAMLTGQMLMHGDAYIKAYYLFGNNARLASQDYLIVDEQQDFVPVMTACVLKTPVFKIVAGDVYQSIYKWRGSVGFHRWVPDATLTLKQSFRFGHTIAEAASLVSGMEIYGTDQKGAIVHQMPCKDADAYLTRTNAEIFERAEKCWNMELPFRIASPMLLTKLKEELAVHRATYAPFLIQQQIYNDHLKNTKEGVGQQIMTVFMAKGLEFDNVHLASELLDAGVDKNLLYVAMTRARKKIGFDTNVTSKFNDHLARKMCGLRWHGETQSIVRCARCFDKAEAKVLYGEIENKSVLWCLSCCADVGDFPIAT